MATKKQAKDWNFKHLLTKEIAANGGWVNAHVHADRAFTVTVDSLDIYRKHTLEEKWDIVDDVKDASEDVYYRRVTEALELMIAQGVSVVGSLVDVDPVTEDRAIKGAKKAREALKDQIEVRFISQMLKGVITKEARYWFDFGAEECDIIGGLPKRDERDHGKGEEHVDILLSTARKLNKMVHIHVDQFNTITDTETEMVCDKTIEHGMQGKVAVVHGISIAAHPKKYRDMVYQKMVDAGVMMIACPGAWIDAKRSETMQPFHNALTPVDEMVPAGVTVALGSDNLADYMLPFTDGDLWYELRLLATGCRFMELDELVAIATSNGRKVLGIA